MIYEAARSMLPATEKEHSTTASNSGPATCLPSTLTSSKQHRPHFEQCQSNGPGSMSGGTKITLAIHSQPLNSTNMEINTVTKSHWEANHTNYWATSICFHGESWKIFMGWKGTDLKYQLLGHNSGHDTHTCWASKLRFHNIKIQQVDWSMV